MDARDFYVKQIEENPTANSVQLMEDFAKHIIEINFCNGSPLVLSEMTFKEIEIMHKNVNKCVDWVNS